MSGRRTHEEAVAALAAAARLTSFDDARTWRDALFAPRPGGGYELDLGYGPDRGVEPDRALLAALAAELVIVDDHAALLPARLHREWLERILGIPRLPAVPDTVVVRAEVDPTLAPVVLPSGTLVRGGKDSHGDERRYRTTDALTAHGATLAGVRVLVPGGTPPGRPGVVLSAPELPLVPPETDVDAEAGPDAPHTLRVTSPALAFPGGNMKVRLHLVGASTAAVEALRTAGSWYYLRTDGTEANAGRGTRTGHALDLALSGGCAAAESRGAAGNDSTADHGPCLEWRLDPGQAVPESLALDRVDVEVRNREGVVPEAAFANDGALDVSKEFQPFGATAKRGDALYLRSEEAFAKSLATLDVRVELMPEATASGTSTAAMSETWISTGSHPAYTYTYSSGGYSVDYGLLYGVFADQPYLAELFTNAAAVGGTPRISWQRRAGGTWQEVTGTSGALRSVSSVAMGGTGSDPSSISGQPGRYVRAFLDEGDFGWTAYQRGVADFATGALKIPRPADLTMPTPPVPPTVTRLTLGYTTTPTAATVTARSGWRTRRLAGPGAVPFRLAASSAGHTGMVAVGLELPHAALGSTVTLYVDLLSAAPDVAVGEPDARWEWWDGDTWRELVVADGTRFLREPGLLRFVAPRGWATGCPEVSERAGRWLRLVTGAPLMLGTLLGLHPDAVVAEYVSSQELGPDVALPLPPGTIKGLLTPVPGVKRLTNLTGVRGRAPESDADYARRASARARHRGRALTGWDHEQHVLTGFPEVAAVRCLPHTGPTGGRAPGSVALVVVPDRPEVSVPRPSVSLSGRIRDALEPLMPLGARLVVLPPAYVPVTVTAHVLLRRGVPALLGRAAVTDALAALLHPTGTRPVRWGRALYVSSLVAALERVAEVDVVRTLGVRPAGTSGDADVVEVDPGRGLYCAAGDHVLTCEEQL